MTEGRKYVLVKPFEGFPKRENVKIVEEVLPPLKDGEYLCRTLFLSLDPCQRVLPMEIGDTIGGYQLALIIASKTPKFPIKRHILGYYGWKTHHIYNENSISNLNPSPLLIPEIFNDVNIEDFMGPMGIPGLTAYVGLFSICNPKPGETIVISAAAGGVGTVVGQLARSEGCRVLGIVGSEAKGEWIKSVLGFHDYINYKDCNLAGDLKKLAPDGVNMYFDNVGGEISSQVIKQMTKFGRIAACGSISTYNDIEPPKASNIQFDIARKSLKMIGFRITDYRQQYPRIMKLILKYIRGRNLKFMATTSIGFDVAFDSFCCMLRGDNIGKAFVKL